MLKGIRKIDLEISYGIFIPVFVTRKGDVYYRGKRKAHCDNGKGYKSVCFTKTIGGIRYQKRFYVHRLVAMTFIGSVSGMEVNHLNLVKHRNQESNLEITSSRGNKIHARLNGAYAPTISIADYMFVLLLHHEQRLPVFNIVQRSGLSRDVVRTVLNGGHLRCREQYLSTGNFLGIEKFKVKYRGRRPHARWNL